MFSVKFKLMTLGGGVGGLMLLFIMIVLPPSIEKLTAEIMKQSAGSDFIVQLLSDNLALGMDAMLLDDGKSIDNTLNLLKIGDEGNLISSASIFDTDMKQIRGDASEAERVKAYGKPDQTLVKDSKLELIIFSPLKNARGRAVGFVEIVFSKKNVLDKTNASLRMLFAIGFMVVVAGSLISFLIGRRIIRVLERTSAQMNESGEQVASASAQVFSASQSLAQRTSDQASSLQETSASLDEISSMIRQNADHAGQANALMQEAAQVMAQANVSMKELNLSIDGTAKASEETFKIIKTIDEIAFQTNLLALNAAVEAARAGEAGMGFAVVADEVRSLAIRSAEAAKNTSELIEGTVRRIKDGTTIVSQTHDIFTNVIDITEKVSSLIADIAAASREQARGTDQVDGAVAEIDKATQQNLANAETLASASQELNAQAEQMKASVLDLVELVGARQKGGA